MKHPTPQAGGSHILFLVSTMNIGGSEQKIVRLANALAARGRRVTLAYLNGPAPLLDRLTPVVDAVHLQRTGKFSVRALLNLRRTIRERGIDTVVSVNLYASLYAGLLARLRRRSSRVRFVASINTTAIGDGKTRRRMRLFRPLLCGMDLLLFGAVHQRELWRAEHLGPNAPESHVLYNGVDAAYFSAQNVDPWRAPGWPPSRIVIGAVGMLRPEKSHDHLLRALAQLHARGFDVGAVIVGEGAEHTALRKLAAELHIADRVHMAGAVRDVRPYLAGFDVFVLTSTAVETFSNAALEALAMQCPVITSRIGGMSEMLKSGGGVIYEPGNIDELVSALQALVASEQQRAALAEQARKTVIERFSLEAMVESFLLKV